VTREVGRYTVLLGRGRNARITARYHGFDGRGSESLQRVGIAFGVTRERVRQIVTKASARLRAERPVPQVLDRCIAFVADHIPTAAGVIRAEVIEAEMRSEGLTAGLFRLEGVIKAAELLGRRLPFAITQVNGERLVHSHDIPPLLLIVHMARRVVAQFGMTAASDVAAKLRNESSGLPDRKLIVSVLTRERGFRWLDPSREWFWSETGHNPVLDRIRKILSLVNPIRVSDLRAGISRGNRNRFFSPPREVLLEFCRQAPGLQVCDDRIEAKPRVKPEQVLSRIEKQMVYILSEHGGLMTASELKSVCPRIGLNKTTCYLYLVRSPIFSKCGSHLYKLIGSNDNLINGDGAK